MEEEELCSVQNKTCSFDHLNLKKMKKDTALARLDTLVPSSVKTDIIAAANLFGNNKK
jgi:hypothetical protein